MRAPCGMMASGDGWPPNSCGGGLNTPMTLYGTPWMWMRWPIGSIRSNSSSASFWLTTTTWAEAASSTSVKDRPGETSPPATLGHAAREEAPHPERLRAGLLQHVGDALVEAADDRADHHHDHDADRNPEDRERRPRLVGPQRLQRDADAFEQRGHEVTPGAGR